MICKCGTQGNENQAGGNTFWYCPKCKDEIIEIKSEEFVRNRPPGYIAPYTVGPAFHKYCPTVNNNTTGKVLLVSLLFAPIPTLGMQIPGYALSFCIPDYNANQKFPPEIWIARETVPFYGVNRSIDSVRLSGVEYDGRHNSKVDAIQILDDLIYREGGHPDTLFMHEDEYKELMIELGTKSAHLLINQIKVIPDIDCPKGLGYCLTQDTWERNPKFGTYCTKPQANGFVRFK